MMRKIQILVLVVFANVCQAQFITNIKIRQSFQSEDTKPEPATFAYTNPEEGAESYLVDFALGLVFKGQSYNTLSAFGEYHRNTLVDKEQNTIQGGLSLERWTNKTFNVDGSYRNSKTFIINANVKYSKNIIDTIHSLQFTAELTQLYTARAGRVMRPNSYGNYVGRAFAICYSPAVGIENEYVFDAPEALEEGNILRGVGKLFIGIKPCPFLLRHRVELYANLAERYDIMTIDSGKRDHLLIDTGINYILIDSGTRFAKISASFNKGDNPAAGLKEQQYFLISLKVKV